MSVCDCRSLLCSIHYRIVAEHVTQRSGGQVCQFEYNRAAFMVKIRRTRAGTHLQNCLIVTFAAPTTLPLFPVRATGLPVSTFML